MRWRAAGQAALLIRHGLNQRGKIGFILAAPDRERESTPNGSTPDGPEDDDAPVHERVQAVAAANQRNGCETLQDATQPPQQRT